MRELSAPLTAKVHVSKGNSGALRGEVHEFNEFLHDFIYM
jgi:hypothetical protein